ncbi:trypsin delta-like [Belonocnema kinseyi]|uniref:trypsin delta-like n=1 Tax=Belonocnema kinseyi TaxID=2817044 RepID=UPI00143CF4CA|nr:trypsin delta-like [Belonocnema kinseyi]
MCYFKVFIQILEDLHVRKKRLISQTSSGSQPVKIHQVPYVVNILMNSLPACGGSILSEYVIITAAHCFDDHTGKYSILSGSIYVDQGTHHSIKRILIYPHFHPKKYGNDLALFSISPAIDFARSTNRKILLYNGHVPPNTLGTVSGWGSIGLGRATYFKGGMVFPKVLRSITVPTISEEQCWRDVAQHCQEDEHEITNKVICAFDRIEGKRCSYGDSGGPLVVNGQLAGIMAWGLENEAGPDVFMNLSHPAYRNWILSNMEHSLFNSPIIRDKIRDEVSRRVRDEVSRRVRDEVSRRVRDEV